jgi:hypothetical protein
MKLNRRRANPKCWKITWRLRELKPIKPNQQPAERKTRMHFGHALYYPNISLNNKNWLKHALLHWEKLSRIVPGSVTPSDSEEVIQLRNETAFIEDYAPKHWDVSRAFHVFSNYIDTLFHSEETLRAFARRQQKDYDYLPAEFRDRVLRDAALRREVFAEAARSTGSYIHVEKLSRELKEKLYALGLAVPGESGWEDWVRMDSDLGHSYMAYLAKSISEEQGMATITDISSAYGDSIWFASQPSHHYGGGEFEHGLAHLLLTQFMPKNINNVTLDQIINIREKYPDERKQFLLTVQELGNKVKPISNKKALDNAVKFYAEKLSKEAKTLKEIYEGNHIEVVTKTIAVTIPTSMTALIKAIPPEYAPLPLAAGVILGAVTAARTLKKDRADMKKNPLSYLLHVNAELEPGNMFRRVMRRVDGLSRSKRR